MIPGYERCYEELDSDDRGRMRDLLSETNERAREGLVYNGIMRAHVAATARANASERAWRIGIALAFIVTSFPHLLEFLRTTSDLDKLLTPMFYWLAALIVFLSPLLMNLVRAKTSSGTGQVKSRHDEWGGATTGLLGIWVTVYISIYIFLITGFPTNSLLLKIVFAGASALAGFSFLCLLKMPFLKEAFVVYFDWIRGAKVEKRTFMIVIATVIVLVVFILMAWQIDYPDG